MNEQSQFAVFAHPINYVDNPIYGQTNQHVLIKHEMGFAQKVADRIIFMDKGNIIEEATPEVFFKQPQTERAKAFLNILSY